MTVAEAEESLEKAAIVLAEVSDSETKYRMAEADYGRHERAIETTVKEVQRIRNEIESLASDADLDIERLSKNYDVLRARSSRAGRILRAARSVAERRDILEQIVADLLEQSKHSVNELKVADEGHPPTAEQKESALSNYRYWKAVVEQLLVEEGM